MRKHSEEFKSAINRFGRELDSKITFDETELGNEQLNAVTPILQSSLLKSVMKGLDIDSNVDIPIGTILNYKFGVLIDDENYEYLDFGNYIVYSSEKQEDTNSYNIVAYDKMLNSMVEYTNLKDTSKQFPMSVRDYIEAICNDIGLTFKNAAEEFVNFDRIINEDLYAELGYTYRDVLDELAQVTASNIIINDNDELEIKYVTDTNDTIDEEFLKDINVAFGQKYGPINSIVLSRSAGSDNVYLQDEQSVADNGLCELKISDNQIMNGNDRSDYLPAILEKLNGLEYYINDFSSTGVCYYEVADRYNVKIGENIYPCVMFNDEIEISQGLEENIHTDLPEQAETDYTKADKTDRKINQTYLIVDKQNQKIESVVSQTDGFNERITKAEQTVDGFKQTVEDMQQIIDEGGFVNEERLQSAITQSAGQIQASVSDQISDAEGNINKSVDGKLKLYILKDEDDLLSVFNVITDRVVINSNNFKLDETGKVTCGDIYINGGKMEITKDVTSSTSLKDIIDNNAIILQNIYKGTTSGYKSSLSSGKVELGYNYTYRDASGLGKFVCALGNYETDYGGVFGGLVVSDKNPQYSNLSGYVAILPNAISVNEGDVNNPDQDNLDYTSINSENVKAKKVTIYDTPTASNHAVRLQDLDNAIGKIPFEFVLWEGSKAFTDNSQFFTLTTFYRLKTCIERVYPLKSGHTRTAKLCMTYSDNINSAEGHNIHLQGGSLNKSYIFYCIWGDPSETSATNGRVTEIADFNYNDIPANQNIAITVSPPWGSKGTLRIYKLSLLIYDN